MKRIILLGLCYTLCLQFGLAQLFENKTAELPDNGARGQSMDVQAADLDGDGDLDIVLANEFQANTILWNDGAGTFTNGSQQLPQEIHDSEDVTIADFDLDGDLDLVFCSEDDVTQGMTNVHEFYLNDGMGNFSAAAYQLPDSKANAVLAILINNDDWPDLLLGNDGQNQVLINNGDGTFKEETLQRLPTIVDVTQDISAADIDDDGDLDLFVGNENGNRLLINDGSGVFSDESISRLPAGLNMETRKVTFADVDGNGTPDVFLSNVAFIPGKDLQNRLFLNDGAGQFTDVTLSHLPTDAEWTLDGIFTDLDFDDDLDLLTTGIGIGGGGIDFLPIRVFENDGVGKFVENTDAILGDFFSVKGLGIIAADLNGDALDDLYVCDRNDNFANSKDHLFLRKAIANSIQEIDRRMPGLLYPNPTKEDFYFWTPQTMPAQSHFYLVDVLGNRQLDLGNGQQIGTSLLSFKLNDFLQKQSPGMYFFQVAIPREVLFSFPLFIGD